jgi:hypothetical protein
MNVGKLFFLKYGNKNGKLELSLHGKNAREKMKTYFWGPAKLIT